MSFTSTVTTEKHINLDVPVDPYKFAKNIEYSQDSFGYYERHTILFNKGRYFETSIYSKELRDKIVALTGLQVQYENMFVDSWKEMEDFVIAMNICGYYVLINVDWI